jgi:transcriptional regulator with XRE-family HTH domain
LYVSCYTVGMSTIVGRRVKDRRNELDLTQEDLTRLVQDLTGGMLRRPNLSKIENDNYGEAGAWVVVALSKALRTSPDYLLGFTDDPTPNADPDAILRSMDEQDRAIVRRLAALVDGMTIEQKIAMLSFAENFIAGSVNHPRQGNPDAAA